MDLRCDRTLLLCIVLPFCLGACMPKEHQVRSGTDPQYFDDDVRFRTT